MLDYSSNLDQASRLALCPVSPFVDIRDDESEETARLNDHPLSARSCGFVMPSRARAGVVSILPHGGEQDNDDGEAFHDDDESEETQEREAFAPYVLPSARNRSAVSRELKSMGYAWND